MKTICHMKPPANQKGVREFLGMIGFHRKFTNRFADAAKPMMRLPTEDIKFSWSEKC